MFAIVRCRIFCAAFFRPKNINIKKHKPVSLSVLYACETWSLILREEHTMRVLENRVSRKLFEPKRDEVTGVEKTTKRGAV
jgi:hypothetical protein